MPNNSQRLAGSASAAEAASGTLTWPGTRVPAHDYDVALLDLDGVVYSGPHAIPGAAAEHLALAAAMRPDLRHYTEALRSVRATLRAQSPVKSQESDLCRTMLAARCRPEPAGYLLQTLRP